MLKYEIKIEGVEKLQGKLDADKLLGKPVKHALSRAALAIQRRSMIFSPVDTGRLRGSWTNVIDFSPIPTWAKVGTVVSYAEPLEYSGKSPAAGHGPTERIPFFRPAISESKEDIDKALEETAKMIEEVWSS